MDYLSVRFYAELNDWLEPERRQTALEVPWPGPTSVGELVAAHGVPAAEVELFLVNGRSVGPEHRLAPGDRVSLFPMFESLDTTPLLPAGAEPLRRTRFVLDTHLGRLAAYLRMLGFDTLYRNDYDDPELARISVAERRVLLTRDRALLERKAVTRGYLVRQTDPRSQLTEVVERLDLRRSARPFSRCLRCNGRLRPVPAEAVAERLAEATRREHDEFKLCPGCDRVLWPGSHYARMRRLVDAVLAPAGS